MRQALCSLGMLVCLAAFSQEPDSLTAPASTHLEKITNDQELIVGAITIEGNELTREFVILRELPVEPGDTIGKDQLGKTLSRTHQNLLNTSLFNFAEIEHTVENGRVNIHIRVVERWYLWPIPFFEIAETNFNTWWITRDFRRTIYGMFLSHENVRGRRETFRAKAQFGFTRQFGFQYSVPYLDSHRRCGSLITGSYYSNKEIPYRTINNKRVFYRDPESLVREEWYGRFQLHYRPGIYTTNTVYLSFTDVMIQDTIRQLQPDYLPNGRRQSSYFSAGYSFIRDRRDFRAYPLKGYLGGIEIVQQGLGLLKNEPSVLHTYLQFRKYFRFTETLYFATSGKIKYSLPRDQAYYLQRGLGYSDLVRGYEYYVIDGQHWALFKSNAKFRLVKPSVKKFKFIPSEKFNTIHYALYLNVFFDGGFVSDRLYDAENTLSNEYLTGFGVGMDLVTYYDRILRVEVSHNRLGETGFFINFTAPI